MRRLLKWLRERKLRRRLRNNEAKALAIRARIRFLKNHEFAEEISVRAKDIGVVDMSYEHLRWQLASAEAEVYTIRALLGELPKATARTKAKKAKGSQG